MTYEILPTIRTPDDVKALPENKLNLLAAELRQQILETVSQNGGHLASNLGMVEATIALHRVFDCPDDAFVFDVGHQSYAHKLLTGRWEAFSTLRQTGGLSGFTSPDESPYDAVFAGHSGTSLSTAIGLAAANRLAGNGHTVVAVIGDGSFTGGMIYEALNQLAGSGLRLVILLNDNEMSISPNVGGVSHYLSLIRTSEEYFTFKVRMKNFFSKIPLIGGALVRAARWIRDFLKKITGSETWFEAFGLEYIGPVNGHNIRRLSNVLEEAKTKDGPVIVHMITKKGAGYAPAEESPDRFHSPGPFDPDTGIMKKTCAHTVAETVSDWICETAGKDEKLCAITAAMMTGCGLEQFAQNMPDRFFDVGIAEEHAAAVAGGLAVAGMHPVLVLYSTFAQRTFDQLWHDVALQRAHVVLLLSHCGFVAGDGVTHQGLSDLALITAVPGTSVWSPDTVEALSSSLDEAMAADGLAVVRYPKGSLPAESGCGEADGTSEYRDFGTWKMYSYPGEGKTLNVVTYGRLAHTVRKAAAAMPFPVKVAVLRKIWPLPEGDDFAAHMTGNVLSAEEAIAEGGIGEKLAAAFPAARVVLRAVPTPFIPNGDLETITRRYLLDEASLADAMRSAWNINV